jgi:hypothetical protein
MKGNTMSDPFIGNQTKTVRTITVSRKRALQILAGALAVAVPARLPQAAEAGKHRKPLAFVGATVTGIIPTSPTEFSWQISAAMAHPASNYKNQLGLGLGAPSTLTPDKVRAQIVEALKDKLAANLQANGHPVPKDRIAVTLL